MTIYKIKIIISVLILDKKYTDMYNEDKERDWKIKLRSEWLMAAILEKSEAVANKIVKKYEIWLVEMPPRMGSEQGGVRPAIIVQNAKGNIHSPTVLVAPITTSKTKANIPTHVFLSADEVGVAADSTVLAEQTLRVDRGRMRYKLVNDIPDYKKREVMRAIVIAYGVDEAI
ncbi:type II toxin-antitoxin system PemK/MazF family toxin [Paenibacillus sophorae]|uniref:type II toxin-antitoxin system PemK/MazF family toxin n=1 Tax=Paenibacillus sophorae TaxID=1333845 RepID=UPI001587F3BC|nr:type II toxin-antitoxin system PemK/MazF family toxin [Paenibacillus sophorae]